MMVILMMEELTEVGVIRKKNIFIREVVSIVNILEILKTIHLELLV
jgi:hypothetical protein